MITPNKFKTGDKVETILALNENGLMNKYAWAHGRDLKGEFYVERYCRSGNGAVRLTRNAAPYNRAEHGMPLWVHEAELMLVKEAVETVAIQEIEENAPIMLAPAIPQPEPTIYTTTQVCREFEAGTVIECVNNVSAYITPEKQYTLETDVHGNVGVHTNIGHFLTHGQSTFKIVKTAEEANKAAPIVLEFEAPVVMTEPTPVSTDNEAKTPFGEMSRDEALAIVGAFLDVKEVEYYSRYGDKWVTTLNPTFSKRVSYRVKPELTAAQKRVIALKEEIAKIEGEM